MYSITHLEGASPRRIGSLASDPLGSLPRCDVVYESPAEFPWEGLPVGDGSTAGLLWTEPSSIIMALHRPDVWKCSEQSPSFGAWSWEREEKHGSQLSCGRLSFSDGMPSFDPYYLENFRQKIDTSTGCVELRA
ncbi:MAG TPA: hypothetical protein PLG43_09780, partial [Spirochaetia bacterium]|nr:hypothetical protein [Spirochaetia bacterium]